MRWINTSKGVEGMILTGLLVTSGIASVAAYVGRQARHYHHTHQTQAFLVPAPAVVQGTGATASLTAPQRGPVTAVAETLGDILTQPQSVGRDFLVAGLTTTAAVLHYQVGLMAAAPIQFWNAGGYVSLLVARYIPQLERFQPLLRYVFIGYALLTITIYFSVWGADGFLFDTGVITKLTEAVLWLEAAVQPSEASLS
jgi:hypothetical protein